METNRHAATTDLEKGIQQRHDDIREIEAQSTKVHQRYVAPSFERWSKDPFKEDNSATLKCLGFSQAYLDSINSPTSKWVKIMPPIWKAASEGNSMELKNLTKDLAEDLKRQLYNPSETERQGETILMMVRFLRFYDEMVNFRVISTLMM